MQKMTNMGALADLVRASNANARDAYQSAFDAIAGDELQGMDLRVAETPTQRVPVIVNGSNRYMEFASAPLSFNFQRFTSCGVTPDLFVVIPEVTNLLREYTRPKPRRSCVWDLTAHPLAPIWLAVADAGELNVDECIRAFDSHHSVLFYWKAVVDIVRGLGGRLDIDGINVLFKSYRCDLASRFSDASTLSLFVHSCHLASESGGGNTGRVRTYRNPTAPNKASILVIGDSHSFTAISQLMSCYYEHVTYCWANRVSGYGSCSDLIERTHADHVIEESAERFLLSNFRLTW